MVLALERIDMSYFYEVLGGILIGIGSVIPLLYEGRIAGVSGYAGAAMRPKSDEGLTGLLFVVGLILRRSMSAK